MFRSATAVLVVLGAIGCADQTRVELDGQALCVPAAYVQGAPSWIANIKGLDASYTDLWVLIPADEVLKAVREYAPDTKLIHGARRHTAVSVLIAGATAISGRSQAQTRLLEVTGEADGGGIIYKAVSGTDYLRVDHYPNSTQWSIVRSERSDTVTNSVESLHHWIVAYCGQWPGDDIYRCSAQRIYRGLTYEFYISEPNVAIIERLGQLISGLLDAWIINCHA